MKHLTLLSALIVVISACNQAYALDKCFVHGDWESDWGNMTFFQHGLDVAGDYTYHDKAGKVKGTMVDGHTMTLDWSQEPDFKGPKNAGKATFVFSNDCTTWSGKWGYGSEQPLRAGWDAKRIIFTGVDNPDAP